MDFPLEQWHGLPVTEKLRIVEAMWDDIGGGEESQLLPDWHKDLARRRAAELDAHPEIALTREELWRRCSIPSTAPF